MKSFFLIICALALSLGMNAQKLIKQEDVPRDVVKRFEKKFRGASKVKWFKVEKVNYLVKFEMNENEGEAHLDKMGVITGSKLEVDADKLPSRAYQYLKDEHKRKKVHRVYSVTEGRKDQYFSVILHESQGRKKSPLVYEVQFDRAGKYLTTFTPNVEDEVAVEERDRFIERVSDEQVEDVSDEMEVRKKDLPSDVLNYLDTHYDYEYREKEIKLITTKEMGQVYYVVMKKQGEKVDHVHYFSLEGKLLKKEEIEL